MRAIGGYVENALFHDKNPPFQNQARQTGPQAHACGPVYLRKRFVRTHKGKIEKPALYYAFGTLSQSFRKRSTPIFVSGCSIIWRMTL